MSAAGTIARQFARHDPWSARAVLWCVSAVASLVAAVALVLVVVVPQSHARFEAVSPAHSIDADPSYHWLPGLSGYRGQGLDVLLLEPVPGRTPPAPAGIETFPAPGTAYVSPALADALAADPALAARVPGTVVGTISPDGLSSPRVLRAVVGTDLDGAGNSAERWGADSVDDPHQLPEQATRMLLLTLALLPWLVVLVSVATGLAARLRPRAAALALIGASRDQVRRFVATSVSVSLVAPGVVGAGAGVLTASAAGPTGLLGLDFTPPGWAGLIGVVLLVVAVQSGVAFAVSSLSARRAYRSAWVARSGPTAPLSRWGVAAAGVGVVSLVVLTAGRWVGDVQYAPSATTLLVFLGATAASLVGTAFVAARCLRGVGDRFGGGRGLAWVLGWRDVAFRTTPVVTQTATLATLLTVLTVAGGVQLMIDQSNRPTPATWWTTSVPASDTASMAALVAEIGPGTVLTRTGDDAGTTWGTCASLTAAFGTLRSESTGTCEDGQTYDAGDLTGLSLTEEGDPVLDENGQPSLDPVSVVDDLTRVVTSDPAEAGPANGDAEPFYLLTRFPDVETAQNLILATAPAASFSIYGGDYEASIQAPRLERLTVAAAVLGLLIALAGLAVGSLTVSPSTAALHRLGASRRRLARRGAARAFVTTGTATVLASLGAVLIGQAYLAIGSLYAVDTGGILTVVGLGVGAVAVATVTGWLGGLRRRA